MQGSVPEPPERHRAAVPGVSDLRKFHMSDVFDAWHQWFFDRWKKGDGWWPGGGQIHRHVMFADYDGFGGEW